MFPARYMLDTNVLIWAAADSGGPLAKILLTKESGELVLSAITFAELERGWRSGRQDRTTVSRLLTIIPVVPFDAAAGIAFGKVMAAKTGRPTFDRLIAAHAIALGLTVVTADKTGFTSIEGLSVEDWSA